MLVSIYDTQFVLLSNAEGREPKLTKNGIWLKVAIIIVINITIGDAVVVASASMANT